MAYKTPEQIAEAAVVAGAAKARVTWDKALVGGFLAGAYIAFGGLLSIAVTSGLDPKTWGTLPTLFAGAVFATGLILVVIAGADLLTGNMALVPVAALRHKASLSQLGFNFSWVLIGNLLGSLFVAYFLAVKSGVIGTGGGTAGTPAALTYDRLADIAALKGHTESAWQIFLRAVGCNWLVCLAVWLALGAEDISGKILGIFFPIMAFVAMGFDHVVANMFFLPAALFADVPGLNWGDVLNNWLWAFLGNFAGAGIFVATSYWFLYLRDTEPDEAAPATTDGTGPGVSAPNVIRPR